MLLRDPTASVHLLDADAVALEAAKANVAGSAGFLLSDCWQGLSGDGRQFDAILSNPPVHFGRLKHDLSVVQALVEHGSKRLAPGGAIFFVTQELIPVWGLLHTLGMADCGQVVFTDGRFVVWKVQSKGSGKKRKRNTQKDNLRKRAKAKAKAGSK
jgi:16S rRNA G1207 methylase RsmC